MKKSIYIGIDPGINVGFAVWNIAEKKFDWIETIPMWKVFKNFDNYFKSEDVMVRIENPNTWIGFRNISADAGRLQGAGSVKASYKHIVEYLEWHNIEYQPVKLQGTMKKISSEKFKSLTGWTGRTNEHGRDAAMMIFGMG